ncbi:ribosomal L27 protein-domain-containing protein [Ampelomyces quisqualis]|uniref:Large ribosomal subunit protein bL27m n=1 Tax=Ampelomyces quisqualis TaxID=50730 RepID=A0A6A5QXP7_AMPQU|nr:ribosomal L27 protein-domain-containing protein [Ampelomyces quisqualis]
MLLPRILAPVRAPTQPSSRLVLPSSRALDALRAANGSSAPPATITLPFVRYASHQSQGRANGAKDGPGKRLGAKKSGGEYAIPGNIIFRQRGTTWFPGENCKFGRDHCIFATESGYVRYYKDPNLHPKRQYIGIALEKDHRLPYPVMAPRQRRLGMVAVARAVEGGEQGGVAPADDVQGTGDADAPHDAAAKVLTMGNRYAYREANWRIGRAAERAGVQVKQFVPGNRWVAWRKSQTRIKANRERKRMVSATKKGGKSKKDAKRGR